MPNRNERKRGREPSQLSPRAPSSSPASSPPISPNAFSPNAHSSPRPPPSPPAPPLLQPLRPYLSHSPHPSDPHTLLTSSTAHLPPSPLQLEVCRLPEVRARGALTRQALLGSSLPMLLGFPTCPSPTAEYHVIDQANSSSIPNPHLLTFPLEPTFIFSFLSAIPCFINSYNQKFFTIQKVNHLPLCYFFRSTSYSTATA